MDNADEYQKYSLGPAANEYIQSQLEELGWDTLAREILNHFDLKHGKVFAWLPPNLSKEQLEEFHSGWLIPPEPRRRVSLGGGNMGWVEMVNDNLHVLRKLAREYLLSHDGSLVFISDALMATNTGIYSYLNDEFYNHLLKHNIDDKDLCEDVVSAWPLIGVFAKGINDERFLGDRPFKISLKDITNIVLATVTVFVGAYHDTSFLVWEKE